MIDAAGKRCAGPEAVLAIGGFRTGWSHLAGQGVPTWAHHVILTHARAGVPVGPESTSGCAMHDGQQLPIGHASQDGGYLVEQGHSALIGS